MKKVLLIGFLGVAAFCGYRAYDVFGPGGDAYRTYLDHASAEIRGGNIAGKHALARFGLADQIGDITAIDYELESEQDEGEGRVRIVAIQYVTHVYRDGFGNPSGRPKVSKARHTAVVARSGDGWKVTSMKAEPLD